MKFSAWIIENYQSNKPIFLQEPQVMEIGRSVDNLRQRSCGLTPDLEHFLTQLEKSQLVQIKPETLLNKIS